MTIQDFYTLYKDFKSDKDNFDIYNLISLIDILENHPEYSLKVKRNYKEYFNLFNRFFDYYNSDKNNKDLIENIVNNNLNNNYIMYLPLILKNIILYTLNKIYNFESESELNKRITRVKQLYYKPSKNNYFRYDIFMSELNDFVNTEDINMFNKFADFVVGAIKNEIIYENELYGIYYDFNDVSDSLNIYPYLTGKIDKKLYKKKKKLIDLSKDIFLYIPRNNFNNAIMNYINDSNDDNNGIIYWDGLNFANAIDNEQFRNSTISMLEPLDLYSEYIVNIKDNFDKLDLIQSESVLREEEFALRYEDKEFARIPDVRFAMLFELEKARYFKNKSVLFNLNSARNPPLL